MKISYVNLKEQWRKEKKTILPRILKIFENGDYVGGQSISEFESRISKYCKKKYAVSFNSGTDALTVALKLLGVKKNDEVITPPNSFISSTTSIWHIGAKPVFVDVKDDLSINEKLIEKYITKKTKAIMPVHLTGRVCEMSKIQKISRKYNIPIIEDAAQSIGSRYKGKPSGSFGDIACFSAHPLKNLNACGDAGFLVTNNKNFYNLAKKMRNHGLENRNIVKNFGFISRMDTLQAEILNFRLSNLASVISARRKNAAYYLKNINSNFYKLPHETKNEFNTYHTFVIQTKFRDKLQSFLKKNGVETAIHYPIPIHLQPASKYLGYKKGDFKVAEKLCQTILTLPINQYLKKKELDRIIIYLNNFAKKYEKK